MRDQFSGIYNFLINKWWFDELYERIFVRPTFFVSGLISGFDRNVIDRFIDALAKGVRWLASAWERLADQTIVDGFVNKLASWTYGLGLQMREDSNRASAAVRDVHCRGYRGRLCVGEFLLGICFRGLTESTPRI